MTKQEFIEELREALDAELDSRQVSDQIAFYNQYIDGQIRAGRTEADILDELGDARIIARNIIDGIEQEEGGYRERTHTYSDDKGNIYQRTTTTYTSEDGSAEPAWKTKLKVYGCLGMVLIVLFVILALVTRLFFWLLPSIIVVALLVWIFRQFNGR